MSTRWGTVQVQITVTDGVLTEATAIKVPDANGQDRQINSYAVPILEAESVAAGNARIDAVSGATVTSTGYIRSLQAALDEAGLK
ncbi:MAG: FMN-binding protein [Actinomycetales bacterium]|nr:FMN-binding protein [Actinomycetales bacterium]